MPYLIGTILYAVLVAVIAALIAVDSKPGDEKYAAIGTVTVGVLFPLIGHVIFLCIVNTIKAF